MTDYYIPNDAQQKALDFFKECPDEEEYTLQIPTGVGKSFLMLDKIQTYDRVMIVFPRLALLSQFYRHYLYKHLSERAVVCECTDQNYKKDCKDTAEEDVECYNSLKSKNSTVKDDDEIIILTTYHSFSFALKKYKHLDATIFDEAHHRSESKIIEYLENTKNKEKCGVIYNFSATCDLDVNEGEFFNYPFRDAINNCLIRDFVVHVMICNKKNQKPKNPQHFVNQIERIARLSNQKNPKYMAFSSFSEAEKENRSNVTKVVKEWSSFSNYWVKGIIGNTKPNDREKIFQDLAAYQGPFAALVSCRTLGEGIDIPKVNGAVFIDPRSSTREIIQIIGRALRLFRDSSGNPLPWEQQLPATIVLPVYVDLEQYEALTNDQDRDNFLRDAVENQENGTFDTVLNVASALREHNPEMSELCLFYPSGCSSKDVPAIRQHLDTQGYRIQEVPTDGNCFFSCLAKSLSDQKKTAGEWRQEIISELEDRPFQEFCIDPESVKDLYMDRVWNNGAMDVVPEVAAEYLGRCIRVHQGDGRVDCFGSSEDVDPIDLLLSENHYSLLVPTSKKGSSKKKAPQCSKEKSNREKRAQPRKKKFHFHVDDDTRVLWRLRPDILSRGLGQLEHRIEKNLGVFTPEEKAEFALEYAKNNNEVPIQTYKETRTKNGVDIEVQVGRFWHHTKSGNNKEILPKLLENEYFKKDYDKYWKKKDAKPTEKFTPEEMEKFLIDFANEQKKVPAVRDKKTHPKNGVDIKVHLRQHWANIKLGRGAYKDLLPKLLENEYFKKDWKKKEAKFTSEEMEKFFIDYANEQKKVPAYSYKKTHTKNGVDIEVHLGQQWGEIKRGRGAYKGLLPKLLENEYFKKAYDEYWKKKPAKSSGNQEDDNETRQENTEQDDEYDDLDDDQDDEDNDSLADDDDTMSSITTTAKEVSDKDAKIQRLELEEALKQNKSDYKKGQYLAPNKEMKIKINDILAAHLPSEGLVIVLDHTDFGTASTLVKKDSHLADRLLIPQRGLNDYKEMKKDTRFGSSLRHEDIMDTVKRKNKKPLGLVYLDLMGSIKEAEPILEELKKCTMVKGGIIAVTISCRDGEEAAYTNEFVTKLAVACYKIWPTLDKLTEDKNVLVYGEGIRMATMVFRV